MTVQADIVTTIKGLCGNRIFPGRAPFGTDTPYVTYSQVGGEVINPVSNEVANKKNGRFQFNVWSTTRSASSALILQIEEALVVTTLFQAKPIGAASDNDDVDMNLYGSMQDFSIWSNR